MDDNQDSNLDQSIDPSQIQDPNLRALVTQAQSQGGVDPNQLFHVAAQMALQAHTQPAQAPNQSYLTGVQSQVPGTGIGSALSRLFTGRPLMHPGPVTQGTTQIPDQSNLPQGMQLPQIGTDANGKPVYDYAAMQKQQGMEGQYAAMMARLGMSNPTYTKDQLVQMGYDEDKAQSMIDAGLNTQKGIGLMQGQSKVGSGIAMAKARQDLVNLGYQRLSAMLEGPGAVQGAMKDAASRLSNIQRFNGVYNTIANNNFEATNVQRNLLNTELARFINASGVLTNEAYNNVASETAGQKIADWTQWLTNTATPAQFKSFAQQAKTIADQEEGINTNIFAQGQKMSALFLHGQGSPMPPAFTPGSTAPNPGQPISSQSQNNPGTADQNDYSMETSYLNKIGARLTPANLKWARGRIGKPGK